MTIKTIKAGVFFLLVPLASIIVSFLIKFINAGEPPPIALLFKLLPIVYCALICIWSLLGLIDRLLPTGLSQRLLVKIIAHLFALVTVRQVMSMIFGPFDFENQALKYTHQWLLMPVMMMCYVIGFHVLEQKHQAKVLQQQTDAEKLRNLKMQSNPHFLLNTLNLLHQQIHNAPEKAADLLLDLSQLLRSNLVMANQSEVSLGEEIEVEESYLFLQKQRFGERLNYQANIDADCLNAKIPSLLLQPIIENTVKYAIAPFTRPGNIIIKAWRNHDQQTVQITISDNGPGFDINNDNHNGTGLTIFKQSLQLHFKDNFNLTSHHNDELFTITLTLPYRQIETVRETHHAT